MTRLNPLLDFGAQVREELIHLDPRMRGAFATACAERLYPAYRIHVESGGYGDMNVPRRTLDAAWACAREDREPTDAEAALVKACAALIPSDIDAEQIPPYADDALAAAAYALDTFVKVGDVGSAGWAASRGLDTLDEFLVERDHLDLNAGDTVSRIWADPLVQAERSRQLRDLVRLGDPLTADPAALVEEVRAEATSESILPFEALQTRDHT